MGLGDSLNSLAGGYARGQAQYAANEKTRQEQAQAAAKAAQDAAEFRLKLAQHDQTLMNSAETEWKGIMDTINSDSWTPALLPTILPRAANFDKTYGKIWNGGSATEMLQKALHLEPGGEMEPGVQGPPDQNAENPLMGFVSPEQKYAADERAMKSRSAEAARAFTVQAMEHVRDKSGSLPEEAEFYRRIYDFQDAIMRTGEYDPKTIDEAMDIIRENAAGYYKGLANQLDQLSKQTTLSDAISERTDKTIRNISQWVNQLLMFDANGNAMTGDLFAERTPLRLEMEKAAASLAMQGMSEGQIRANLIFKHRDEMGGLELDIRNSPYQGSLTLMSAPPEFKAAVNRFYDLNESPDEDQIVPMWNDDPNPEVHGGWVVNTITGEGKRIYVPTSVFAPTPIQGQGTQYPKVPAGSRAVSAPPPSGQPPEQQAPAREATIQLRDGSAERAKRQESASAAKAAKDRESAARKSERMATQAEKQAAVQNQQAIADRNNVAFRLYRSGEITEEQFKEELRRAKAGEPSLFEEKR